MLIIIPCDMHCHSLQDFLFLQTHMPFLGLYFIISKGSSVKAMESSRFHFFPALPMMLPETTRRHL